MLKTAIFLVFLTLGSMNLNGQSIGAEVESISTSVDGSGMLTMHCMFMNSGEDPIKLLSVDIRVLDAMDQVVQKRELIFFQKATFWPKQKAMFTEYFYNCSTCERVEVYMK